MRVKDIMHGPTFVDPSTPVADAAKIMVEKNISSVIVGTPTSPVGMFTERDMLREVVVKGLDSRGISLVELMCGTELRDKMCRVIVTVNQDETLDKAAEKMMGRYIRHLPVTDGSGKIVGMVSARTIMNAMRVSYFKRSSKRI